MKQKRPFGVTIIAIFEILSSVLVLASYGILTDILNRGQIDPIVLNHNILALQISLILVRMLTAYGLWRLKQWGWTSAMVLTGLLLGTDLIAYAGDSPQYVSMVINIVIVFYLNQRDVQRIFIPELITKKAK
ncbi:MAG TPA: hypothetical protein VJZ27_05955 [Aggregatilineales bacterium]|nr:hypothetical protein [Aggregatilineales bacterium]